MTQDFDGAPAHALEGERRTLHTTATGLVSWYESGRSAPAAAHAERPMLLIHSVNAAASAYEVKPVYDHFRGRVPVYAIDLPGFGFSERSERRYSPRLMTDAILALAAQIAQRHAGLPIDALALSLSSEYLARAAVEAPALFRSIAFESPTGFSRAKLRLGKSGGDLGMAWLFAALNRRLWRRGLFDLLTRPNVIRYFLRRTWGSAAIDEGLAQYDWATARPLGAEHAPLRFLSGYLFSADSGSLYASVPHPVWVSHGVRGDFSRYVALQPLADKPNWRVDVFPSGALPHFECTQEFLRHYEQFLETPLPADAAA